MGSKRPLTQPSTSIHSSVCQICGRVEYQLDHADHRQSAFTPQVARQCMDLALGVGRKPDPDPPPIIAASQARFMPVDPLLGKRPTPPFSCVWSDACRRDARIDSLIATTGVALQQLCAWLPHPTNTKGSREAALRQTLALTIKHCAGAPAGGRNPVDRTPATGVMPCPNSGSPGRAALPVLPPPFRSTGN